MDHCPSAPSWTSGVEAALSKTRLAVVWLQCIYNMYSTYFYSVLVWPFLCHRRAAYILNSNCFVCPSVHSVSFENRTSHSLDDLCHLYGQLLLLIMINDAMLQTLSYTCRSKNVRSIMAARIALAKRKNCDGIEPDNVDGFEKGNANIGFTAQDQLNYNKWLAKRSYAFYSIYRRLL